MFSRAALMRLTQAIVSGCLGPFQSARNGNLAMQVPTMPRCARYASASALQRLSVLLQLYKFCVI